MASVSSGKQRSSSPFSQQWPAVAAIATTTTTTAAAAAATTAAATTTTTTSHRSERPSSPRNDRPGRPLLEVLHTLGPKHSRAATTGNHSLSLRAACKHKQKQNSDHTEPSEVHR